MKITIVGPGALGCLFAGLLAKAGNQVSLLDKDAKRAEKINQQGIIAEGVSGNWEVKVRVVIDPAEIGKNDLIIIATKSYDTKEAAGRIKNLASQDCRVITVQNGVGNIEIISEAVGQDKVIGGITSQGATLLGAGHIRHAGKGETVLGRLDAKIPVELRAIREIFNRSGIQARISRDIKGFLWSKLIVNVGINALTAITGLPNGKLLEFEGTRRILREAVGEAVRLAKRKRIKLAYDDPLAKVEAVCESTAANISSMLQDVLRKKKTEIDFINGVIVRQAQEAGIPAPVNACLVDLVKTIEASYDDAVG